ncbi:RNA polymerase sigma factor [Sinomicrobium soli]|uniref:RNA polymerase sigma factor n=1 Tax=Sinomicrobium sp. N-1-3-6 TaxID=2219864 RepID=UPI000DCD35A3|nr:RNA polymerase sigma-70 factor [Sinomicrobium sp. N-1-3-6]RAV29462.1 RNA polymerase sigma-70 factor [Sinomicrobium sp. N-1-3-6]
MDDIALAKAIHRGDEPAFQQFFKRYYQRLLAYVTSFTHHQEQSEDIAQQAFLTLWTQRHKLDTERSPKGYLYMIAHNIYIDEQRQLKRRDTFFDELKQRALQERIKDDEDLIEQRMQRLKELVEHLPPKCRRILQMNKLEGLKQKEIAQRMDISVRTVETQIRIALLKIREGFEDDEFLLFVLQIRF